MLCLMFHLGDNRYAVAARDVVEVLPYAPLDRWPGMPACAAGMLVYRGQPTAVIDLMRLAHGVPGPLLWNTRIIMVGRPVDSSLPERASEHLGLLVNRLSTCQLPDAAGPSAAGQQAEWGWLEHDEHGLYQRIDLARLLPAALGAADRTIQRIPKIQRIQEISDAERSLPR
jgi:chemotaxis-related protein WspB